MARQSKTKVRLPSWVRDYEQGRYRVLVPTRETPGQQVIVIKEDQDGSHAYEMNASGRCMCQAKARFRPISWLCRHEEMVAAIHKLFTCPSCGATNDPLHTKFALSGWIGPARLPRLICLHCTERATASLGFHVEVNSTMPEWIGGPLNQEQWQIAKAMLAGSKIQKRGEEYERGSHRADGADTDDPGGVCRLPEHHRLR